MSDTLEFEPGAVIEVADATYLHQVEDVIAGRLMPEMDEEQLERWAGRPKLKDLLQPSKFYGRIGDIALEVMEDPHEHHATARERGFSFYRGSGNKQTTGRIATFQALGDVVGLTYLSNARSSRGGDIGQIQAELWYLPAGNRTAEHSGYGPLMRALTQPRIETQKVIDLQRESRENAYRIASSGIRRARPQPMRD